MTGLCARLPQVDDVNVILVARQIGRDDEPMPVLADLRIMTELGILRCRINEPIGRLLGAELVEIDAVVERRVWKVAPPPQAPDNASSKSPLPSFAQLTSARVFQPLELVGQDLAGRDVHDLDRSASRCHRPGSNRQAAYRLRLEFIRRVPLPRPPTSRSDRSADAPLPLRPSRTNRTAWFCRPSCACRNNARPSSPARRTRS